MRENKENCSVNHKHIVGVLLVFWPTMIVLHRDQMDHVYRWQCLPTL